MKLIPKKKPVAALKKAPAPAPEEETPGSAEVLSSPGRKVLTVTCYVPPGKSEKEVVAWLQKFFDFFHPTLEAKVEPEVRDA